MKKEMFKTNFRAIVNVRGVAQTLSKSSDTEQGVINVVKEAGLGIKDIVKIEEFTVSTEKQKGKKASKY